MRSLMVLLPLLLSPASSAALVASVSSTLQVVGAPDARVPGAELSLSYRGPMPAPMRVVRAFQPPLQKYGAGHLGVDLAAAPGSPVLAAAAGTVRFAGTVAGRGVVVIAHPDGISTEYEPLRAAVRSGQQVVAGQRIGVVLGSHRGCPVTSCLHWGARRGADYVDPLDLLRPPGVVRLLPWDYRGSLG